MVKLSKYNQSIFILILFVVLNLLTLSCQSKYQVVSSRYERIAVSAESNFDQTIDEFIKPYREKINQEMNKELSFNPNTLDKANKINDYQSVMGNWMSDVVREYANKIFNEREQKNIDLCLLNHGGIRAILPQGIIRTQHAFEIMPFENSVVVLKLKGSQIKELVAFVYSKKTPHPLSGVKAKKNNDDIHITINNQPLDLDGFYYVATSDYLSEGGDNMSFFNNPEAFYDLDYKIRNILIDYFSETKEVGVNKDIRLE